MKFWFKINRDIEKLYFYFGEKFSRTQCWLDLNLLAEWKQNRTFFVRGHRVDLSRGQLAISIAQLSERWSMNARTVMSRLEEFEKAGMIRVKRSNLINVISIVDYGSAENECDEESPESQQHPDTDTATQTATQTAMQTATQTAMQTATQTAMQTAMQSATQTAIQTAMQTAMQSAILSQRIEKKEKEIKEKEKYSPSYSPKGEGAGKASFLGLFFADSRRGSLGQLCMHWHMEGKPPNPGAEGISADQIPKAPSRS